MENNFIELKNLDKAKKLLSGIPNGIERAASSAINRSIVTLKKELKKKVTTEYNIKSTEIEKSLNTKKATFSDLTGTIYSKSPTLSLYKFFVSQNSGIYVKVKKTEGKKLVVGKPGRRGKPFISGMRNGHIGIFQRKYKSNYPIKEHRTLSIPQMLGTESIMEYIAKNGQAEKLIEERIEKEIDRILKGYL